MTKKLMLFALMAETAISVNAQELEKSVYTYDKSGNVQTVEFSKTDKDFGNIKSADVFFRNVLKVRDNNTFVRNQELKQNCSTIFVLFSIISYLCIPL